MSLAHAPHTSHTLHTPSPITHRARAHTARTHAHARTHSHTHARTATRTHAPSHAHTLTASFRAAGRKFIIRYYMATDEIDIFEPHQLNSGMVAGRYLIRAKYKNEDTGKYYTIEDVSPGKLCQFKGQVFKVLRTDEYTRRLLAGEQHRSLYTEGPRGGTTERSGEGRDGPTSAAHPSIHGAGDSRAAAASRAACLPPRRFAIPVRSQASWGWCWTRSR